MVTVIVSSPLPGRATDRIEQQGHRVVIGKDPRGMGRERLLSELAEHPDAQALICLLGDRVDQEVLQAGRALKVVANCAVGIDNLDLEALRARGVMATNTPDVLTDATADLAFALMLDACRNVTMGDRLTRAGKWEGWSPTYLLGVKVNGATLGIIGFGRIGQAMARRARGFAMRVLYHDVRRASSQVEQALEATCASVDDLVAQSDIVSLHCPFTPETRGMMNRQRLSAMRKGAVLVNTARGACVDEKALAELLRSGHLFAAGLDVYEREPLIEPSLLELPNVVLAPHIGSADRPTRERMAELCADAVIDVLDGREPRNRVA